MNYEKEDQAMPKEELLKNKKRKKNENREKKKVKVTSLAERNEAKREHNDAIYYEKLFECVKKSRGHNAFGFVCF